MSRAAPWREAALKKAHAGTVKAGVRNYRIDIMPDGTISIIVGEAAKSAARRNSWDDVIEQ